MTEEYMGKRGEFIEEESKIKEKIKSDMVEYIGEKVTYESGKTFKKISKIAAGTFACLTAASAIYSYPEVIQSVLAGGTLGSLVTYFICREDESSAKLRMEVISNRLKEYGIDPESL